MNYLANVLRRHPVDKDINFNTEDRELDYSAYRQEAISKRKTLLLDKLGRNSRRQTGDLGKYLESDLTRSSGIASNLTTSSFCSNESYQSIESKIDSMASGGGLPAYGDESFVVYNDKGEVIQDPSQNENYRKLSSDEQAKLMAYYLTFFEKCKAINDDEKMAQNMADQQAAGRPGETKQTQEELIAAIEELKLIHIENDELKKKLKSDVSAFNLVDQRVTETMKTDVQGSSKEGVRSFGNC